jgi:TM2 domain-containing membrane protein YozV
MLKKTLLVLMFLSSVLLAGENPKEIRTEYNPFLAGTLSWYSAGLGQIYTGSYVKGAIFFAVDSTLLILMVNSVADFNLNIDDKLGFSLNVQLKSQKDIEYNSLMATFFLVSYVSFHFYNVFDAVMVSARKNAELGFYADPLQRHASLVYTEKFN